jgi:hypothetical protein
LLGLWGDWLVDVWKSAEGEAKLGGSEAFTAAFIAFL